MDHIVVGDRALVVVQILPSVAALICVWNLRKQPPSPQPLRASFARLDPAKSGEGEVIDRRRPNLTHPALAGLVGASRGYSSGRTCSGAESSCRPAQPTCPRLSPTERP